MGYRSDVAFAVYGDTSKVTEFETHFYNTLREISGDAREDIDHLIERSEEIADRPMFKDGTFLFMAEDVKWYDDYPAVAFFEDMYNFGKSNGLTGERMHVGEDLSDTDYDYYGNNEWVLSVERTISVNL